MAPMLKNTDARRLFLHVQGLTRPPGRKMRVSDLLNMIEDMGFVQIDSINTVERAHHMILFSRNQTYRKDHLRTLLEQERSLFENWTHDASIIPTRFYPYWKHRFRCREPVLRERWKKWRREEFEDHLDHVLAYVREKGATLSRDMVPPHKPDTSDTSDDGWWDWHPSKTALEFHWHTGALAVSRRQGFQKVYDLSERVLPQNVLCADVTSGDFVDWACRSALDRLGFATSGEIAAFWDIVSAAESRDWCARQAESDLVSVRVETSDGSRPYSAYARPGILDRLRQIPEPPKRVRILSPFDPVLRDRKRAARLFNFQYRIEVFVPEPQRTYGYYVFPVLENDSLIGRIDMKCHRKDGCLCVTGLWPERKVRFGKGRMARLMAELERVRRFTGMDRIAFSAGYMKEPN